MKKTTSILLVLVPLATIIIFLSIWLSNNVSDDSLRPVKYENESMMKEEAMMEEELDPLPEDNKEAIDQEIINIESEIDAIMDVSIDDLDGLDAEF